MSLAEKHKHKKLQGRLTSDRPNFGERAADAIAYWGGSWTFITILLCFLFVWMTLNAVLILKYKWDPYPFILLNLFLSFLAAFQAPVILMSQNRSSEKDRRRSEYDYLIDRKSEREIEDIQKDLKSIKRSLKSKKP